MTIAETMLGEFDHEMATTRTVLERVPLPSVYSPTADLKARR